MRSENSNDISRRKALAAVGAAGMSSLAGCNGGGGGGGTETTRNDSRGGITGTASGDSGPVTITMWTNVQGQSQVADRFLEKQINLYKQRTGNDVIWVKEPVTNVKNGGWMQRMESGQGPTLYQTSFSRCGAFIANGHITPWGSLLDRMNDSVVEGTKWAYDRIKSVFRGFSDPKLKMMPFGFALQDPFVARKDHFEKAGLSIEDDFPPTGLQDLINIATTLQKDGPADIGFQVHGSPGDLMDEITPTWAHERGGKKGLYLNQDWSDTNYDSDAWKWSLGNQVKIYRNLGLSSENATSTSDEDACRLIYNGKASMSQVGMLNYGLFANQAPELLNSGTLQFGPSWEGKSGYRGEFNMFGFGINDKPQGMDSKTWQRKLDAVIDFLNQIASVEVQKNVLDKWGLVPFNQKAWSKIPSKPSNFFDACRTIAEGSEYAWPAHPDMASIQYNIPGPIFQRAMNGQISADKACNLAAERIRQRVFTG
jgi:multiple sugar transport system substrate-binding protein